MPSASLNHSLLLIVEMYSNFSFRLFTSSGLGKLTNSLSYVEYLSLLEKDSSV
jgi:hypothetical protein